MKKIFLIILLFISATVASGDVIETPSYYYQLHLYYDNGRLVADRDFQYIYDVIPGTYTQPEIQAVYPYIGEVISIGGVKLVEVIIDPSTQLVGKTSGKLTVTLPYFANAKDINIYDNKRSILVSVPVGETSFCNDDKICDSDVGENYINCANDCTSASLATVSPSASPSASPTALPEAGKTSSLLSAILYVLGGLVIVGGYFGWRWYQKKNLNNITIQ